MMRKYLLVVAINFMISSILLAQPVMVSFHPVYGGYEMKSMKHFQEELFTDAVQMDLPFKIVDDFPAYIGYELQIGMDNDDLEYGLQFGGRSTGGRVSYSDYSGKYNIDNELRSFEVGTYIGLKAHESAKINFMMTVLFGVSFTNLNLISDFHLTDQEPQIETVDFASKNFLFAPGLKVRWTITKILFADFTARYDIQAPGKLRLSDDKRAHLENKKEEAVRANWSGFRIGIGLGFKIR